MVMTIVVSAVIGMRVENGRCTCWTMLIGRSRKIEVNTLKSLSDKDSLNDDSNRLWSGLYQRPHDIKFTHQKKAIFLGALTNKI
jgi:hypothetical protein